MALPSQHMSRRSRLEISAAMLTSNPRLNPSKTPAEAFLIQPLLLAHNPPPNDGTFSDQTPAITSAPAINYAAHSLSQANKGHWISINVPKAGGRPQKSFPQTMKNRQAAKPPHSAQVQPSAINFRASPLPRSTNHPLCPGQTPAARHIVRTAVSVRSNRTRAPGAKTIASYLR